MENYLHRVLGVYPSRAAADAVLQELVRQGLPQDKLEILEPGSAAGASRLPGADSDDVLTQVLRDGAIGTAVGTAAGAVGTAALVAAGISVFVASPLIAPLAMLGWGASVGGLLGAAAGAQSHKGNVSDLVRDALEAGHVGLLAYTTTEAETTIAHAIIGDSMNESESNPNA